MIKVNFWEENSMQKIIVQKIRTCKKIEALLYFNADIISFDSGDPFVLSPI